MAVMVSLPTRPSVPPASKPPPASGPAGVKTETGQPFLDLLHFREGRGAFGAGERVRERSAARDPVCKMHDRERVIARWIVRAHRVEVRPEKEGGPARDRNPQPRG